MNQRDWLLLLLGDGLDPIRIQKGMFLFAQESHAPASEIYTFRPYNWGPFSPRIYQDLEDLERRGAVERVPVVGTTWSRYRVSSDGAAKADTLRDAAPADLVTQLDSARETVAQRSFSNLLRYVYDRYPDYAVSSVFQH